MEDFMKLDRKVTYQGTEYQVVEILNSEMLLVVAKESFDAGVFPMPVLIIPGE